MIGGIAKRPTRLKKMNKCPTESEYLYPRHADANRHNDTEERPTLFFSCLNNLAIFLPEKESNAFQNQRHFSSVDVCKVTLLFWIRRSIVAFIQQLHIKSIDLMAHRENFSPKFSDTMFLASYLQYNYQRATNHYILMCIKL